MPKLAEGVLLYRNQDQDFERLMKGKTAERRVGVDLVFTETENGFAIEITDEEGISVVSEFNSEKQPASKTGS